jgi:hypothetical protein
VGIILRILGCTIKDCGIVEERKRRREIHTERFNEKT